MGPSTISIGAPVHKTQYHILDEHRRPVAEGEIGELYIGGVQLARGYLHRPDLTADRFIGYPLLEGDPDGRLYKTGDLAYWNADGTVQFVGRTDNQVKLRGFRVELDEIKLAIENHDWVRNAAVIVKDDPRTGFQNLLAFVELNPKEAALMDQGNHGAHHQSKASKLQVRAQLSQPGLPGQRTSSPARGGRAARAGSPPRSSGGRCSRARRTGSSRAAASPEADILRLLGDMSRRGPPRTRRT